MQRCSYPDLIPEMKFAEAKREVELRLSNYVVTRPGETFTRGQRCCESHWMYPLFAPRPSYSFFSPTTTHNTYHYHGTALRKEDREERKAKERRQQVLFGVLCTVGVIVSSFFVGTELRTVMETREDEAAAGHFKEKCHGMNKELAKRIKKFVVEQKNSAYFRLGLKVSLFAAFTLGAMGGFLGSGALIAVGTAAGVAATVGLVFNMGYNWGGAEKNSRKAEQFIKELKLSA